MKVERINLSLVKIIKERCEKSRKPLQEGILLSKSKWVKILEEDIYNMPFKSKMVWEIIRRLEGWTKGHHLEPFFASSSSKMVLVEKKNKENIHILGQKFSKVFVNLIPVDWSDPEDIYKRKIRIDLNGRLTKTEFEKAVIALKRQGPR